MNNLLMAGFLAMVANVEQNEQNIATINGVTNAIEEYSKNNPFATMDFNTNPYSEDPHFCIHFKKLKDNPDVQKAVAKVRGAITKLEEAQTAGEKIPTAKGSLTKAMTALDVVIMKNHITDEDQLLWTKGWCIAKVSVPKKSINAIVEKTAK